MKTLVFERKYRSGADPKFPGKFYWQLEGTTIEVCDAFKDMLGVKDVSVGTKVEVNIESAYKLWGKERIF